MMVVTTMVFVGLITLGVNVYACVIGDANLRIVAQETARYFDGKHYFCGVENINYNADEARQSAAAVGVNIGRRLGLALDPADFQFDQSNDQNGQVALTVCTVTLRKLKLPFGGGLFPVGLLNRQATGAAVANIGSAPMFVDIGAPGANGPGIVAARVPCCGIYRDIQGEYDPVTGRLVLNSSKNVVAPYQEPKAFPGNPRSKAFYAAICSNSSAARWTSVSTQGGTGGPGYTAPVDEFQGQTRTIPSR